MALARAIAAFKNENPPELIHLIQLTIELAKEEKDLKNKEQARQLIETTLKSYGKDLVWYEFFNQMSQILKKETIRTTYGEITIPAMYRDKVINEIQNAIYTISSVSLREEVDQCLTIEDEGKLYTQLINLQVKINQANKIPERKGETVDPVRSVINYAKAILINLAEKSIPKAMNGNEDSINILKLVFEILNNPLDEINLQKFKDRIINAIANEPFNENSKDLFIFMLDSKLFDQIDLDIKVKWIEHLDLSGNDLADILDTHPEHANQLMDLFDKAKVGNRITDATVKLYDGSKAYLLDKLNREGEIKVSDDKLMDLLSDMSRDEEMKLYPMIANRASNPDDRLLLIALSDPSLFNPNKEDKRFTKITKQDTQTALQNLVNLASDEVISQAAANLWDSQSNEKYSKLTALYKAKIKKDIAHEKNPADSIPDDIQGKTWFVEQYLNNVFTEFNDASPDHKIKLNEALFDGLDNLNDEKNYFRLLSPQSRHKLLHLFSHINPKGLSNLIHKLVSTEATAQTINTYASLLLTILNDHRNLAYLDPDDLKELIKKMYFTLLSSQYDKQRQEILSTFKANGIKLFEKESPPKNWISKQEDHFKLEVQILGRQFDLLYESDKKEDFKLKEKFITNFLNDISDPEKDERNSAYISLGKNPEYRTLIAKLVLTVNPGILHAPSDPIKTYIDEIYSQTFSINSLDPSQIKALHTLLSPDQLIELSIEFIKKLKKSKEEKGDTLDLDLTTRSLLISVLEKNKKLHFPKGELDTIASYAFEQHSSTEFSLSNASFVLQVRIETLRDLFIDANNRGWHELSPVELNTIINKLSATKNSEATLRLSSFIASYLKSVPDEMLRNQENREAMTNLCQVYFDLHHDNDDKMNEIFQYFMDPNSPNIKKEIISQSLLNTKKAVRKLLDNPDNVDIFEIIIGHLRNIVVNFVFDTRFNSPPNTTFDEILNQHMGKVKPIIQKEMRKILFEQNDETTAKLIKEFATRDFKIYKASITSAVYEVIIPLIQPYVSKQIWEERINKPGIRGILWRVAAYLSGGLKKANEAITKLRALYEKEKEQSRPSSPQLDHKGQPDAVLRSITIEINQPQQPKDDEKLSPSPIFEDYFRDYAAGEELKRKIGPATKELKAKAPKEETKLSSSPTGQFTPNNLPSHSPPKPPVESKRKPPKIRGKR